MRPTEDRSPLMHLAREVTPPPALRPRVESQLMARGLLRRNRWPGVLAAAAALLLSFGAGWALGVSPIAPGDGNQFVLLLYEPASYQRGPREERVAEYGAWARELGSAMRLGEELGEETRMLGVDTTTPGGAVPTGLFVIRAADWESAMAIARSCPHLRYGGVVVVRAVAT